MHPAPFRVVLYRRLMLRIAEELARREDCWGLVTGDSLGQVASQTPENLSVIQEAAELPILRPLIGMDKVEITDQAERIGTFTISIEPDQDCCSLFTPPHPSTKTRLDDIRKVERTFDIGALVKQGLDKAESLPFHFSDLARSSDFLLHDTEMRFQFATHCQRHKPIRHYRVDLRNQFEVGSGLRSTSHRRQFPHTVIPFEIATDQIGINPPLGNVRDSLTSRRSPGSKAWSIRRSVVATPSLI